MPPVKPARRRNPETLPNRGNAASPSPLIVNGELRACHADAAHAGLPSRPLIRGRGVVFLVSCVLGQVALFSHRRRRARGVGHEAVGAARCQRPSPGSKKTRSARWSATASRRRRHAYPSGAAGAQAVRTVGAAARAAWHPDTLHALARPAVRARRSRSFPTAELRHHFARARPVQIRQREQVPTNPAPTRLKASDATRIVTPTTGPSGQGRAVHRS